MGKTKTKSERGQLGEVWNERDRRGKGERSGRKVIQEIEEERNGRDRKDHTGEEEGEGYENDEER